MPGRWAPWPEKRYAVAPVADRAVTPCRTWGVAVPVAIADSASRTVAYPVPVRATARWSSVARVVTREWATSAASPGPPVSAAAGSSASSRASNRAAWSRSAGAVCPDRTRAVSYTHL